MDKLTRHSKKVAIGVIGGIVVVLGLIMVPYPGPGWLVVFAGLAILATEFDWAQRVLDKAKDVYDSWQAWIKKQSFAVQAVVWSLTAIVVIVTIWLFNGYGLINSWLNLGWDWLNSPIF